MGAAAKAGRTDDLRHLDDSRRPRSALRGLARTVTLLAPAKVVAALDIGWVGAATEARIVDLAGLTDPTIATLPGGHTSKAVDVAMLLERGVDTVIVYGHPRVVEQRLLRSPLFEEKFELASTVPLGRRAAPNGAFQQHYDVYRRK
ncbi:MAG TPA: hypothetical protein VM580_04530 [Labilithrix sp.]|nr:hypothetical protein [Labilithrix sp.]